MKTLLVALLSLAWFGCDNSRWHGYRQEELPIRDSLVCEIELIQQDGTFGVMTYVVRDHKNKHDYIAIVSSSGTYMTPRLAKKMEEKK